jgi:protein SCO1/2
LKFAVFTTALFLLVAVGFIGCASNKSTAAPQQYTLRGEVLRLDAANRIVTIRHEKIDGWMEAMTMDFPIQDGEALTKYEPGNHIQAVVNVQGLTFTIGNAR